MRKIATIVITVLTTPTAREATSALLTPAVWKMSVE
jgi:hypothetical protein